ncbi:hypothetical protein EJF18_50526 [Clavispora lusitaniae]|uniref:Uncharacterized protein n=1 Tax=Clavispora lusitaniae TaxID=36911 RepID=A0ACD0WP89_CLALS|nr:hypothetical protein EJF14_50526 [Clavispora lusitaniae]QFZ34955.1 hypothetical protein EJF16_50526 [Clavispora lusitaniae]QFZ40640.1 hypothetical protein EJF15_50526 [Clavispora lusitaniae]QFZ46320.1 hypothetical protein EJF18_50526 [Clavispora lusitaniae]QFZ51982.1 hypothetical protein EJF17_50526 [Clavispora lusitaniae]
MYLSLENVASVEHSVGHLDETCNVGTLQQRWQAKVGLLRVLDRSLVAVVETLVHDLLQLGVHLLSAPLNSSGVSGHLQARNSNTSTVGGLAWRIPHALWSVLLENLNGFGSRAHVGAFRNVDAPSIHQGSSLLTGNLVLGGRRQSHIHLAHMGPRTGAFKVLDLGRSEGRVLFDDSRQVLELDLGLSNGLHSCWSDTVGENQRALGVGQGHNNSAQLNHLQSSISGHVTRTRDGHTLALESFRASGGLLDHLLDVVNHTVTGGFGSDQRTAPGQAFSGQDTGPVVLHGLVGAEKETNLTATHTNVSCWNVGVCANVSGQSSHEGHTETSDLGVTAVLGVKVRASFAAAHRQAGQGVLENSLVAQKLQDGQVDCRVESQASLVWAQGGVESHTVAIVDFDFALVVFPSDTESDHPLRHRNNRNHLLVLWLLGEKSGVLKRREQFVVSSSEFGFVGQNHDVCLEIVWWKFFFLAGKSLFIFSRLGILHSSRMQKRARFQRPLFSAER